MRIASDLDGMALTRWCGDFVFVIAILWIFTIPLCRADEEILKAETGGSATFPCMHCGDGVITSVRWFTSDSFILEYRGEQLKPHDISPHYSTVPNGKNKNDFSIILSPVETYHEGIFTCSINVRGKADIVKTIKLEVTEKHTTANLSIHWRYPRSGEGHPRSGHGHNHCALPLHDER